MARRKLEVVIGGDAKGAQKAFASVEKAGAGAAKIAAAAGAAIIAGAGAAIVGLAKIGDEFDKVEDTIRVGTGATGKALESLRGDFDAVVKTVPAQFGDASTAIADLNTRLGLTGKPLQDVAKRTLELSRITGTDLSTNIESVSRVMGDWGVTADDIPASMDKLFRASQATGIEVGKLGEQMVKYGAPARQLGFDFETTAGLLGKFEKEGVNAELVMGSMRIALGKMAREGEPAQETFRRVVDEIKNAGSASEANAKALELFGARAGPDMAAAIREGRFELGDLYDQIQSGQDTILGAAEDTRSWRESWQLLVNNGMLLLEPVADRVFGMLSDWMQWLVDNGIPAVEEFMDVWGPRFTAAIDGAEQVIGGLFGTVGRLVDWWQEHFGSAGTVASATDGMRAGVTDALKKVQAIFRSVFDAVAAIVGVFVNVALDLWDRFGAQIIDFAKRTWSNVRQMIDGVLDVIHGIFETFAGLFTGDWDRFWEGIKQLVAGVWRAIQALIKQAIEIVRTVIGAAMAVISSAWSVAWNAIKTAASAAWDNIKRIVGDAIGSVRDTIGRVVDRIRDAWNRFWDRVDSKVGDAWEGIKTGVREGINEVLGFFRRLPGRVVSAIGNIGSTLVRAGKDLMAGLLRGIRSSAVNIWDAINPFGDGPGIGAFGGGGSWRGEPQQVQRMMGILNAASPGTSLISGLRPGARTSTGNTSYHARGRAVDFPATRRTAEWINRNMMSRTRELITPWQDLNIWNGRRHSFRDSIMALHDGRIGVRHNHWALEFGGIVKRRPGGIQATIGEGRYDEAVIPLTDANRPTLGGDITYAPTYHIAISGADVADLEQRMRRVLREHDEEAVRMLRSGVRR